VNSPIDFVGGRWRRHRRMREIAAVLVKHGLGFLVVEAGLGRLVPFHRGLFGHPRRETEYSAPEHLRMALEDLGPAAVKLGQIMSTRPDLLPPDLIAELERLRDRVPPVPWPEIAAILDEELDGGITAHFRHVDETPLAAASIGQVHAAVRHDGTRVIVKVRKPNVADLIEADLAVMAEVAELVAPRLLAQGYDVRALLDDFAWTIRSELDYLAEGRNADQLRDVLADEPQVFVPKVHWDLTTSRVLVLDRIDGIRIDDVDGLRAAGLDPSDVASRHAHAMMRQIFLAGFFHADPHPGNLLVTSDGAIGVVDLGMVGRIRGETRRHLVAMLRAGARQDPRATARAMAHLGLTSVGDLRALERDLARMYDRYYGLAADRIDLGAYVQDLMGVTRTHHLQLPAELALLFKTIGMCDGLWRTLDPSFDVWSIGEAFFEEIARSLSSPQVIVEQVVGIASTLLDQIADADTRRARAALAERIRADTELRVRRDLTTAVGASVVAAALIIATTLGLVATIGAGVPLLWTLALGMVGFGSAGASVLLAFLALRSAGRRLR